MSDRGSDTNDDRLDEALDQVLEVDPPGRVAFIQARFGSDPALRERLVSMVQAEEQGRRMLEDAGMAAWKLLADEADGADEPPAPLPPRIGPYEILEELGSGGMGTVYLARRRDAGLERQVALKVIRGAYRGPEARGRFAAEQRILSRMEHPNVARLYDVGLHDDGSPFFVMEYVDGVPIDTYADQNRLSVLERLELVAQVTDALSYAHQNLVVHRDVKPRNILVTQEGTAKLLDFGVAKILEAEAAKGADPLTRPDGQLLTPEYASPEQVRGDDVTTASDVYAAGVLLYEVLTGSRPYEFTSRSPAFVEKVVTERDPRMPSAVAAEASKEVAAYRSTTPVRLSRALLGDLDAILLQALRKEPELRYGSSQALAADIDRFMRRQPVDARPPTWRYRAGRFVSRHRTGLTAAALVVLSLAGGLVATTWQARLASREAARAERVKELLVGLFEGADPDVSAGQEFTAVELLERGHQALLDDGLADEPLVRAELQQIVGGIFTSLGAFDQARPLLDSAVVLADRSGDPSIQASARAGLASLLAAVGDYEEGERVARERLELGERVYEPESAEMAAALTDLASMEQNQGDYEAAESLLMAGLAMDRSIGSSERVAVDLNNLGSLHIASSEYDEAIAYLEESLAIRESLHPEGHTDLATSMANLAFALHSNGDYERADSVYEATLTLRRRLLGDRHPLVATVLNNKASMRQMENRLPEARELFDEALEIRREVFGPDHTEVGATINNRGIVEYYEGDYTAAEASFDETLRIFRANYPEDHPNVLSGIGNLGAVLRQQGKLDEAEVLIRATLETRVRVLGPDHHNTGGSWNNLAGILRDAGRYAEAEEPVSNAVRIFQEALGPEHPDLADARLNKGKILVGLGRAGEWVEEMRLACAVSESRYEPEHPNLADCRSILGLALLDAGDEEAARQELARSVEILEESRGDNPFTQRARAALDGLSGS